MNKFQYVKNKLELQDIIYNYSPYTLDLKEAGAYIKGICPLKCTKEANKEIEIQSSPEFLKSIVDKKKNFVISPEKKIYYCFKCHSHGDVISFIADTKNISLQEALEFLIKEEKIFIPFDIKELERTEDN